MNVEAAGVIHFKNWKQSWIPYILRELYIDQIYARYLHGRKDLTIFDLGLNIGLFSMYAAEYAKTVYAFEPSKESFDIAQKNISENGINNVKLFRKAIAKDDGKTTLYHSTNTTANSTMAELNMIPELAEEVETIRLDTFVNQEKIEHIHFMKMDIEGTEDEVLGSKSFQNIVPILDAFVVELHDWTKTQPQQVVTTIRDYGFKVEVIPSQALILGCEKR